MCSDSGRLSCAGAVSNIHFMRFPFLSLRGLNLWQFGRHGSTGY